MPGYRPVSQRGRPGCSSQTTNASTLRRGTPAHCPLRGGARDSNRRGRLQDRVVTRVCLDSNVLVAAFAARGLCADLLRQVLTDFDLVLPQVVLDEVRRVLSEKLKLSPAATAAFESVVERCEVLPKTSLPAPVHVTDPDDERVLADAVAGGAEVLVTGDGDLLAVAAASPIPILSPRAFVTVTRGGTP